MAVPEAKNQRDAVKRRQEVAKQIYALWTDGGSDESRLADVLADGRIDLLGAYTAFQDDGPCKEPAGDASIDYHSCETLSYEEFFESYMLSNQPVMIRGLTDDWMAKREWVTTATECGVGVPNMEEISKRYGQDIAPVHVQPRGGFQGNSTTQKPQKMEMTLADYAVWWRQHHQQQQPETTETNGSLYYLKDWKFMAIHAAADPMYVWPAFFRDDWLNEAMGHAYKFVYLGPKGTTTRMHADVLRSFSWSTNVCGRKRWYLIPPQHTHLLHDCFGMRLAPHLDVDSLFFPGLPQARQHAVEIIQEEGETLFVPSGWHHTVENLAPTLSINHNWLNGTNIDWSWDKLRSELDSFHDTTRHEKENTNGKETFENGKTTATPSDTSRVGDDLLLLVGSFQEGEFHPRGWAQKRQACRIQHAKDIVYTNRNAVIRQGKDHGLCE